MSIVLFKGKVFSSSRESGNVFDPKGAGNNAWGSRKCIPHSRCVVGDLLSPDGTLTIQFKIDLLGENCPGGIQDQAGLKHKLNKQDTKLDTELAEIKSKLRKIEENQDSSSSSASEKCPMCTRAIKKPMRLQQCPQVRLDLLSNYFYTYYCQGHIICDDCFNDLKKKKEKDVNTGKTNSKEILCVTCKTEYCGRPTVLEKVLGLLDTTITVD